MSGYFKKYRTSFDHPFFDGEPYCRRAAWDWMIGRALYEPGTKRVSGAIVSLDRGQLCDSTDYMADQWKWTRKKVRTFLGQLLDQRMIEIGPSRGRLPSVITISNYNKFQDEGPVEGQLKAGKGPVKGQLRATIEEGEEGKEITASAVTGRRLPFAKQMDLPTDMDPDLERVRKAWNDYAKEIDGKAGVRKLTKDRRDAMRQIMDENGYTADDAIEAIEIAARSEYLAGAGWFTFDWLFKAGANISKVCEGNYGNGRHKPVVNDGLASLIENLPTTKPMPAEEKDWKVDA